VIKMCGYILEIVLRAATTFVSVIVQLKFEFVKSAVKVKVLRMRLAIVLEEKVT